MISDEQKDFFIGRKKFKFGSRNDLHLVVEFDGEWLTDLDGSSVIGTVVECSNPDMWKIGQKKTWNNIPSYWEDIEVKYIPTQEGDKEDDI